MGDDRLDAALDEAFRNFTPKPERVDSVVETYFEKIDTCYRVKHYPFEVIHTAFKAVGLITCSLKYFKNRYYAIRKTKVSPEPVQPHSTDVQTPASPDAQVSSGQRSQSPSLSAERRKAALDKIFGPDTPADANKREDTAFSENMASILTPQLEAQLARSRRLFDERLELLGKKRPKPAD